MTYSNIPSLPSDQADLHEIADFAELECFRLQQVSQQSLINALKKGQENNYSHGVEIDEPLENTILEVFAELEARTHRIGGDKYPFKFDAQGKCLVLNNQNEVFFYLYKYLLLATRLNMRSSRRHADIDGALLFEELAQCIMRCYLGERSKSIVFGTANQSLGFEDRINHLCDQLKEGGKYKCKDLSGSTYVKDDGVDVVGWIPFSDLYPSQIIAFGQCKTGTHWEQHLTSLLPDAFCRTWMEDTPVVNPIRFFFITESIMKNKWHKTVNKAGVFFDRCRIMDYSNGIDSELLSKVKKWVDHASESIYPS